jgi:hypothetical protein
MKCLTVLVCLASAAVAGAAERRVVINPCRTTAKATHRTVQLESALTVVPFAVPVAVPVAVLSQPAVLYGYRAEAATTAFAPDSVAIEELPDATLSAPDVLRTHCASCNAGESARGELRLFDADGALVERLPRRAIVEAVEAGRMPKGIAPLTQEEIEMLREWAKPPRELVY